MRYNLRLEKHEEAFAVKQITDYYNMVQNANISI